MLIGYICKKCNKYITSADSHLCADIKCSSSKYANLQISIPEGFCSKPIFDIGTNQYLTRAEIRRIEKSQNKVWASNKELDQEIDKNKAYNEKKMAEELRAELKKGVEKSIYEYTNKSR